MSSEKEMLAAQSRHAPELLRQHGVSGLGVERDNEGEYYLAVYLSIEDPELQKKIASRISDCPVKFIHTGLFKKFS
jgi:hypothetical protein